MPAHYRDRGPFQAATAFALPWGRDWRGCCPDCASVRRRPSRLRQPVSWRVLRWTTRRFSSRLPNHLDLMQGQLRPLDCRARHKIGRASCRERVCQYVEISVVGVYLKKKQKYKMTDNGIG